MRRIKGYFILMALALSCGKETSTITVIDKTFLKEEVLGKEVQLVDVRTPEEYASGHIANAINFNIINNTAFLEQVETLDKNAPVYLYCKMGGRSNRAAELMKAKGFKKIYDYAGGYNDWVLD